MLQNDGQSQINKLKERVFSKTKEHNIIDIYHGFMISYGFIPFKEFLRMDAHLVDELIQRITEMNRKKNNPGRISGRGRR